jgi:hypothetical protein
MDLFGLGWSPAAELVIAIAKLRINVKEYLDKLTDCGPLIYQKRPPFQRVQGY